MKESDITSCEKPHGVADLACQKYPGDLVEIGLGHGETTRFLLPVAARYSRKVVGIDHYGEDMPKSYIYRKEDMLDTVKKTGYASHFEHHNVSSLSAEAEDALFTRRLAFAFVDGLQFKRAVMADLELVKTAGIIVVDDAMRRTMESQVPDALNDWNCDRERVYFGSNSRYCALVCPDFFE